MQSRFVIGAVSLVAILSSQACVRHAPGEAMIAAQRSETSILQISDRSLENRVKATCKAIQMELHDCITAMMDDRLDDPYAAAARLRQPRAEAPVQQGLASDPVRAMSRTEKASSPTEDPISRFAALSETRSARLAEAQQTCSMRAPHRKSVRSICG